MGKLSDTAKSIANSDKQRIQQLEKLVAMQQERMADMAAKRYKLKPLKASNSKLGSYLRVVIPDTHGSHVDPYAIGAFLKDLADIGKNVREVVWLGDHLDCGGWLAQHHTMGFVAETASTFRDDVDAANDLLDRVQSITPTAAHHYIEGNHEARLEKWCVTQSLRNSIDAEYLRSMCGFDVQLRLKERGFQVYRRSGNYCGSDHHGCIKLGHCYFTHGNSTAKHAAQAMLQKFGGNIVYGHTHREDEAIENTVAHGVSKAWCPGCLCKLQPLWMDTNPTNWNHGYGLQIVQASQAFLHINVPIINRISYLMPLVGRLVA